MSYLGERIQFILLFYPWLRGEETDSCFCQGHLCESERNRVTWNLISAPRLRLPLRYPLLYLHNTSFLFKLKIWIWLKKAVLFWNLFHYKSNAFMNLGLKTIPKIHPSKFYAMSSHTIQSKVNNRTALRTSINNKILKRNTS